MAEIFVKVPGSLTANTNKEGYEVPRPCSNHLVEVECGCDYEEADENKSCSK